MAKSYVLFLTCILLGAAGCGNKEQADADKATKAIQKSFDTAPDPLKASFDEVKAAIASSDFVKAKAALDQLAAGQLSPEQQQAVTEQRQELIAKASVAAQQGDANAMKLVEALRSRRPR